MREPYELTLADGTVLSLRYSYKALRFLEKSTDGHFFGDIGSGRIGADYLSAGLAAGLLHLRPGVKVSEVDSMLERHLEAGGDLPTCVLALLAALKQGGMLKADEAAPDRPTTAPAVNVP